MAPLQVHKVISKGREVSKVKSVQTRRSVTFNTFEKVESAQRAQKWGLKSTCRS